MIFASFLLILYWVKTNKLINNLQQFESKNLFKTFGILSAIFLIIHSIFLGIKFDYDLYKFFRRFVLLAFIVFESLQAGTPVFVSDKTPWLDNNMGGLHLISLDQDKWVKIITKWSRLDSQKLLQKRKETFEYLINLNQNNKSLKQNKILFNSVLNENIIV